jgi:hypothetical protein
MHLNSKGAGADLNGAPGDAEAVQERSCRADHKDAKGGECSSAVVHGVGAVLAAAGIAAATAAAVSLEDHRERDGLVVAVRDLQADDVLWRADKAEVAEIEGRLVLRTSRSQQSDGGSCCATRGNVLKGC